MKYMDWAAMGAASGAYAEASRAQVGLNQLLAEMQRLRSDIDNQRYEREFQKWVEELIYQFNKAVTAISDSPGDPVTDCADIASFFRIIQQNKLNTACISGLENKDKFEQALLKAQNLFDNLKTNSQVQEYLRRQEESRLEQERLRAEETSKAAEEKMKDTILSLLLVLCGVSFFVSFAIDVMPLLAVSLAGMLFFGGIIFNKIRSRKNSTNY